MSLEASSNDPLDASGANSRPAIPAETVQEFTVKIGAYSRKWERYGLLEAPLLSHNQISNTDEPTGRKLIVRETNGEKQLAVPPVSEAYYLLPNEEVRARFDQWAKAGGFELYDDSRYTFTSRTGNAAFLCYLPKGEEIGSYFVTPRDRVQLGFCARNSIDGSTGFGVDVFTYRGLCTNGSIVLNQEGRRAFSFRAASEAARARLYAHHTANLEEVFGNLHEHLAKLAHAGESVISFYRRLTEIELNQEIAEALTGSGLPQRVLPWEVKEDKVTNVPRMNLWQTYNTITGGDDNASGIWHNTKAAMPTKVAQFNALHSTLEAVIKAPIFTGA